MPILALDVGTSSVKAAVLDVETTQPLGPIVKINYELDHPTPDAAEIPPERLWNAVGEAARKAAGGRTDIAGVGLSCLTPALILLDAHDDPLGPFWIHLDRRSRPTAHRIWQEVGPEFLATTGNRPLPGGISAVSFAHQLSLQPTLAKEVRWYLHANSWLAFKMTGERYFDPANACFSGLFGALTDRQWSERWRRYFGVDPSWLPPVVCGRTTVGRLRQAVADDWGLPAGLPVKLGTADTSSAIFAAGMTRGDLLHVVGTTQVLARIVDSPKPSPQRLTRLLGVGDEYVYVAHNPIGGVALDWLHKLCFRDVPADVFFNKAIAEAAEKTTAVELDPPFLGGDRLEIEARFAGFKNLSLATDRLDLLAALLIEMKRRHHEALSYLNQEGPFEQIYLTGGGSDVVRQILPEYKAAGIRPLEEGSLRGVARLFS